MEGQKSYVSSMISHLLSEVLNAMILTDNTSEAGSADQLQDPTGARILIIKIQNILWILMRLTSVISVNYDGYVYSSSCLMAVMQWAICMPCI